MAETTLSDIIDVTVFQDLEPEMSVEKTAFFQSGAVVRNPILDARANAPGNIKMGYSRGSSFIKPWNLFKFKRFIKNTFYELYLQKNCRCSRCSI